MEEKKVSFEDQMTRLDEIVNEINDKALPLDESLKLYEEGQKIIKDIQKTLKTAQEKIEEVIEVK